MEGLTRSNSRRNPRARLAVALGLVAVAIIPAAIAASRYVPQMSLLDAGAAVPAAAVLGLASLLAGRRAHEQVVRTLGRIGEAGLARAGRVLGALGICLALTGAISLGFYGLLRIFAA